MQALQRKPLRRTRLRALPRENHARLDKLFEQLAQAVRCESSQEAARVWPFFDAELRAHLDLEEHLVYPQLAQLEPLAIEELTREHTRIRGHLDEISIDMDLHLGCLRPINELLELLKAHARREDALMVRWEE